MANKRYLADQVKFRLAAGWPDINDAVLYDDVYAAITQKVNAMFHVEHFSATLPTGETIPNYAALSFYEDVTVTATRNGRSQCVLPVSPITLPRNMGVYEIQDPKGDVSFIPLLTTQRLMLQSQPLISDLMGQIGYTPMGKVIEFSKDLTLLGVSKVNMLLVIMDLSKYDDVMELPIPASMEETIILQLVNEFAGVQAKADAKEAKVS